MAKYIREGVRNTIQTPLDFGADIQSAVSNRDIRVIIHESVFRKHIEINEDRC